MTRQTAPVGPSESLFGRDREVAAFRSTLADAEAGRGRLVLVSGEAGIGKTSLIEHAIGNAGQGAAVLQGACHDLMTVPPFGIWIDLFNSYRRMTDEEDAEAVPFGFSSGGEIDGAGARGVLFAEVLAFLGALSDRSTVVLILEDLHWADEASLELLHHLTLAIEHIPALVVGSYRDAEVASGIPLYRWLPGLVRDTRAVRIELRPVDAGAIRALVDARYPLLPEANREQLAAWLYQHGEGIPFFTIELLYNLEADGTLRRIGDGWALEGLGSVQVPLLVRQFVDQRLERLAPQQAQVLQLAAVIGDEVPLDLWSEIAGISDVDLIDVIESAQRAGIFQELETGDGYRFSHALFRATLYNQIILPRRRALHGRLGEALVDQARADPDIVAHHFQMAGDPRAGRWLIAAGRRAIQSFAYGMASERFEQALSVLGEGELPAPEQGWLLCDLAMTFRFADANRGLGYLDRAQELSSETSDEALALYSRWCRAQIRSLRGDDALDEVDAIAGAIDGDEQIPGVDAARDTLNAGTLAQVYGRYGAYDRAERLARRYLDDHPDVASEAVARAYSAIALTMAGKGEVARAREAFRRGRATAAQIRDSHLTGMLLNWELMEVVLPFEADRQEARRQLAADAIAAWDRVQMPGSSPSDTRPATDMSVFASRLLDGDWDTAEQQARTDLEFDGMRFDALRALCVIATRRGQLAEAAGYLQRALPRGPSTPPANFYFYGTLWLQRTAAELALAGGDPGLAMRWIDAHDRWLDWSGRLLNRAESRVIRGKIHETRGDLALARQNADEARNLASQPRQPLALIEAGLLLGHLAIESSDLDAAEQHLAAALEIATACAAPYETAVVQLERVRLLSLSGGDVDELAAAVRDVREAAERLDARPLLDRLDRLESEAADASASGETPGGLSPRELEVLRLVARGMSDAEVGEQLFISPRTVGRHLRSVYNKLGVNSRTAASAFAYQHGLVADE